MSRQVLEGSIENDAWFAYVCHLDPCEACFKKGHRQPNPECPTQTCDRWDLEGPHWQKANPNLGVSITLEYLREQVAEAIGMPSKQNIVRRLNFCEWTDSETVWIPGDRWKSCESAFDLEELRGRDLYLGVDLSSKIDLSAVVAVSPRDLAADEVPIDLGLAPASGDPDEPVEQRLRVVNFAVDLWPLFFMPKATLRRRVEQDRIPYDRWEQEGFITTTAGAMIDQSVIFRRMEALGAVGRVQAVGCDPTNAGHLATWLINWLGKEHVLDIQQGFRQLSEPSKVIEAMIVAGRARHPGNPVLTMCVANAAKEENSWGDIRPVKPAGTKRIDGLVAAILGLRVLLMKPPKKRSRYQAGPARIVRARGIFDAVSGQEVTT
jgi:phage terminase large subunit-like protein